MLEIFVLQTLILIIRPFFKKNEKIFKSEDKKNGFTRTGIAI